MSTRAVGSEPGAPDTIAAIATPPGSGGIGIVRLSGPEAIAIAAAVVGARPDSARERVLELAVAHGRGGERLDEVLWVAMRGPRSFTGEDVAEIHGHGGAANMQRLLGEVLAAGARAAEPGEFSRRAFENGRLDLTQAEAILAVIEASTERALRTAQAQLAGGVGERATDLRARCSALLAELEAAIDFPDGDHSFVGPDEIAGRARELAGELDAVSVGFALGRALRDGVSVAIVGPVNAGKSSLFNALLGEERALVDDEPGTTRDFVESTAVWDGIAFTLIDTAGEREASHPVEQRGIDMGRERARSADLRLVLHPPGDPLPASASGDVHVRSKADLAIESAPGLAVSARTRSGLDALRQELVRRVADVPADIADSLIVTSARQRQLFEQAAVALRRAAELGSDRDRPELAAIEIRSAASALAAIVGEDVQEEMLDALFARFCIGK